MNSYAEILSSRMAVFGGGTFGRSQVTGSALMNGVNVLIKETRTLSALSHLRPQERTDTYRPESRFSQTPTLLMP